MKKLTVAALAVSSVLASSSVLAASDPVEFHGYMRSGVGISQDESTSASWERNRLGRLGNENETYGEIQLSKNAYKDDQGRVFRVNTMLAVNADQGTSTWLQDNETDDNTKIAFRQYNVEASGVFGEGNGTLWAGKKFYQRHDIHITDKYYWDVSGDGAGVENIEMGPGKLSVAWFENNTTQINDTTINANLIDVRYAGIPLWDGARLEVGLDMYLNHDTEANKAADAEGENGTMFTAEMTQDITGGFNKFVFQATQGSAAYFDWYSSSTDDENNGFRLIDHGVVGLSENVDLSYVAMYQIVDRDDADDNESFNVTLRPVYKWDDIMKTYLEVGYFTADEWGTESSGQKVTIAQAWAAGSSFWARPEIRVYSTYLRNGEADSFGEGTEDTQLSFGIQAEAWW